MKRNYKKPYLAVEPYQLDASVAAACSTEGAIPIWWGEMSCTYYGYYYGSELCAENIRESECYHGPYATDGVTFVMS